MTSHRVKFEVVPLYREFLRFLKKRDFLSLKKNYLIKYKRYLEKFCTRWDFFGEEEIMERIKRAKISHYSNVLEFDSRIYPEIDKYLEKVKENILTDLFCKIILYIGFFCPDGKTIVQGNKPVVGISIDRIQSIRDFPLILAHEIGHAQRRKFFPQSCDSFNEDFFSEGIAFYFSYIVFPEIKIQRHLFIKRGEYSCIIKNIKEITQNLNEREIKREIFNFLSFNYIKFLVEDLKFKFEDLICENRMPLTFKKFLSLFKKNIVS